jgi:hypothetical protein
MPFSKRPVMTIQDVATEVGDTEAMRQPHQVVLVRPDVPVLVHAQERHHLGAIDQIADLRCAFADRLLADERRRDLRIRHTVARSTRSSRSRRTGGPQELAAMLLDHTQRELAHEGRNLPLQATNARLAGVVANDLTQGIVTDLDIDRVEATVALGLGNEVALGDR